MNKDMDGPLKNIQRSKQMQQHVTLDRSDYQLSFFPELETIFPDKEKKPLIQAFIYLDNKINHQQQMIDQGLKAIDFIQQSQKTMKIDIKKDLLVELATKADISALRGEMLAGFEKITGDMNSKYNELDGRMQTKHEELRGEMLSLYNGMRGEMQSLHNELRGEMLSLNKELRGEMLSLHKELRGEMVAGFEIIKSEINSLRIWFKVFAFSALAIVFMFSPNFIQFLKYVKLF